MPRPPAATTPTRPAAATGTSSPTAGSRPKAPSPPRRPWGRGGAAADGSRPPDAVRAPGVPRAGGPAVPPPARRDYLDETGGRYVHVIANGRIETSGAIARALAWGADAVQIGEPLRAAAEAPGGGIWWDSVAAHPRLPRGGTSRSGERCVGEE